MKTVSLRTLFVCSSAALLLTGCPNPNNYTTPRTTPAGKISHSIAAEYWGYSTTDANDREASGAVVVPPTYALRVGLGEQVDIGARVANFSSLGADLKWNFVKSDSFDVAIDPGFQWFQIGASVRSDGGDASSSVNVFHLHAPILLGLNFSESVSLVASPGIVYSIVSAEVETTDGRDAAGLSDGVMGRLGLGFDFRISEKFAIHPQVTFLRTFDEDAALLYLVGLGFNFGNLPVYGAREPAPPQ